MRSEVALRHLRGYLGKNCAEPFPAVETLAKKLGRSRRRTHDYLNELERHSLITRSRRGYGSNKYKIGCATSVTGDVAPASHVYVMGVAGDVTPVSHEGITKEGIPLKEKPEKENHTTINGATTEKKEAAWLTALRREWEYRDS